MGMEAEPEPKDFEAALIDYMAEYERCTQSPRDRQFL